MRNQDLHSAPNAGEQDRRDAMHPGNRFLGRVVACNGSRATIAAVAEEGGTDLTELWSVGRLISISVGTNRVVALAFSMNTESGDWGEGVDNTFLIEVELLGQVYRNPEGKEVFTTGISRYPYLGAIAHRIRAADLVRIYDSGHNDVCIIGKLTQDESLDASIHIPSMLSKHFAVVGSTGVGKSTAVSLLLHKAIQSDPKLRVLILDPHNEFAAAFPKHAVVIDTETLDLPFWLFRLEEFAEVVFRGRPPIAEEMDILRDLMPEARKAFRGSDNALMRKHTEKNSITADTPVPYRMADLLALIDERIGKLEGREEKPFLRSLKMRILGAINDPRYHFMFSNNTINDTILETISRIFRIPGDDRPISTFQLAGIPSEVVNSVASVLCRMAFELALWSNGAVHMLVVCEEAHRYVPSDQSLGFFPTRQAISRIAKEGRKYGVSLGVITQRPGELDQTILSQCSTLFAMRLSNDRDQEIIRSAIPNSSISTTNFISSIGNGEAIAFGEAIAVPMRMRFERVADDLLPKANGINVKHSEDSPETIDLRQVINKLRNISGPELASFPEGFMPQASDRPQNDAFADHYGHDEPESYHPGMLPGESAAPSGHARENTSVEDRFATARPSFERPMPDRTALERSPALDGSGGTAPASPVPSPHAETGMNGSAGAYRPAAPPPHRDLGFNRATTGDQPSLRREPGTTSLRDSILKKPLSSLYKKD